MISLAWNANGRLGRRAYKDATGGLNLTGFAAVIGGAIGVLGLTRHNIYLSIAAVVAIMIVLAYLQYRYAQLSIRRLHDRGMPGWLFWPVMLSGLVVLAGGYVLIQAMYQGGLFTFMYSLMGLMEPIVRLVFYKGIGITAAFALLIYNLFISWNLGADGVPGDNRYGPDPQED